jgi:uncharacterized protein with NAD-binding domain and iron-sulfur cluster
MKVAVVGGGLAGIAAALECADAGADVTLLEGRPRLGGATFSIRRDGIWMDNGQHVFLRCCTEYRRFLERIEATQLTELQKPAFDPGRLARGPHSPDRARAAPRPRASSPFSRALSVLSRAAIASGSRAPSARWRNSISPTRRSTAGPSARGCASAGSHRPPSMLFGT